MTLSICFLYLTTKPIQGFEVFPPKDDQSIGIFIHPKDKTLVSEEESKYVIEDHVETSWASPSLADATVLLMKAARSVRRWDWYVMMSDDTLPLLRLDESVSSFVVRLRNELMLESRSLFHVLDVKHGWTKTAQWWAMIDEDVSKIVSIHDSKRLKEIWKDKRAQFGAPDELYFLTLLKNYDRFVVDGRLNTETYTFRRWGRLNTRRVLKNGGGEYEYTERAIVYDDWMKWVASNHPSVINVITSRLMKRMDSACSLFVRKTMEGRLSYYPESREKSQRVLRFLFVNGGTDQDRLLRFVESHQEDDYVILTAIDYKNVKVELMRGALQAYYYVLIYQYEALMSTMEMFELKDWREVYWVLAEDDPEWDVSKSPRSLKLPNVNLRMYFKGVSEVYEWDEPPEGVFKVWSDGQIGLCDGYDGRSWVNSVCYDRGLYMTIDRNQCLKRTFTRLIVLIVGEEVDESVVARWREDCRELRSVCVDVRAVVSLRVGLDEIGLDTGNVLVMVVDVKCKLATSMKELYRKIRSYPPGVSLFNWKKLPMAEYGKVSPRPTLKHTCRFVLTSEHARQLRDDREWPEVGYDEYVASVLSRYQNANGLRYWIDLDMV